MMGKVRTEKFIKITSPADQREFLRDSGLLLIKTPKSII